MFENAVARQRQKHPEKHENGFTALLWKRGVWRRIRWDGGGGWSSQFVAAATLWRGNQHYLCRGRVLGAVAFARRRRPSGRVTRGWGRRLRPRDSIFHLLYHAIPGHLSLTQPPTVVCGNCQHLDMIFFWGGGMEVVTFVCAM